MENRTILPILAGLLTPILFTAAVWADDVPASPASIAENTETIKEIPQTSGTAVPAAANPGGDSSVVSGLTLLTGGGNAAPVSATTTTAAPIDISAPENVQMLPDGTPAGTAGEAAPAEGGTAEGAVPEGEMLFPGKIKDIKLGTSSVGTLSLTIRWFRPADFGLPQQQGGKVRIERAEQPEGPWTAVAPDAEGISTEQSGYWFAVSRDRDSIPFYIRTVRTDPFGKEWMDMIPTPINLAESFDKKPAPVNNGESGTLGNNGGNNASGSGDFTNVSLEKQMPSYQPQMNGNNNDSTWNTQLNRSETEELTAALDQNRNSSSPAGMKPVDPNPKHKSAPKRPPTDPGQITLNPLLTRGFGLFWNNKERVDADYPGVNNPNDYPAPYSGSNAGYLPEQQQKPSEPPKRSIFMSPQEYQAMLAEEEAYQQQNQRANSGYIGSNGSMNGSYPNYAGGQYPNGAYSNGMNTGYGNINGTMNNSAWSPQQQGTQGTLYSSDAAMLNQTNGGMPAVIYEDANGNVIDNPFPNGQSPVIQGDFTLNGDMNGTILSLPNESMNLSDGTFVNASYSDPMNGSMDMNSMNGPYTSQESTIGTTANYPGPVQQPLNTLPPKPDTK